MSLAEILFLSAGLAADAFAVSLCKGLGAGRIRPAQILACGLYFGAFQALMPVLGYLLGANFRALIESIDHWIAFVLLGCIGFNMICEARGPADGPVSASFGFREMTLLAVATSIDALAVGISFAFLNVHVLRAAACIGCTAFLLSMLGAKLGNLFGLRWKATAEAAGGAILMLMGTKILLEHIIF